MRPSVILNNTQILQLLLWFQFQSILSLLFYFLKSLSLIVPQKKGKNKLSNSHLYFVKY